MSTIRTALGAGVVVMGLGAAGLAAYSFQGPRPAEVEARIAARQEPVLIPAPGPAPRGLPVVSPAGREQGEVPRGHVDGVALRALLLRRQFEELTLAVEQLQWGMESNPRDEHWMTDGIQALGNGDSDSTKLLDAWVEASPRSFAPYLARGTHWVTVGNLRRGTKFAVETAQEEFAGMKEAFERAVPDLTRAWSLQPKAVAAARPLIYVANALGDSEARERAFVRAAEQCPSCADVRAVYLHSLAPRWGGSYEKMDAFAESQSRAHPELGFLRGFADLDRARDLRSSDDRALVLLAKALAAGDYWEFRLERAKQLRRAKSLDAALVEANQAVALRPARADVYFARARILASSLKWGPAGEDLLHGLRLVATDEDGRSLRPSVVKGLVRAGWDQHVAGHREEALRLLELAGELAPGDSEVTRWRARVVASPLPAEAQVEEKQTEAPEDFRAVQKRDYALARERRFAEILPLWDAFLARNPDHGLAYLERSGTHYHMRNLKAALADLKRACDLGVNEGCSRLRQIERARGSGR